MPQVDLSANRADIEAIKARTDRVPKVALVLGSGLDPVVDALADRIDIPYAEIEGMQAPHSVAGHAGALTMGRSGGTEVVCFRGRIHRYQGVSAYQAAYPARLAAALGARTFVVTNAAGSVVAALGAGTLMLITDHINLTGDNPLVGWPGPVAGTPFVAMGDAYDPDLARLARDTAADCGIDLAEGVYAGLLGPTYETPAEVRYLETIGAHVVGMSTVPEVIAARALRMKVLGFSLVTNVAGGSELSHDEVMAAGREGGARLSTLLSAILGRL